MFSGGFISEEVDTVGDKGAGATRTSDVQRHTWRPFFTMPLRSVCLSDEAFFLVQSKTSLPPWDYYPQVPDYIRISESADKG